MMRAASMASIMATPMRSLTLAAGLKNSSLAKIVALTPCRSGSRRRRTIGVSPIASVMESKTRPRPGRRAPTGCAGLAIASLEDMTGPCALIGEERRIGTYHDREQIDSPAPLDGELAACGPVAACDHAGGLEQLLDLERVGVEIVA